MEHFTVIVSAALHFALGSSDDRKCRAAGYTNWNRIVRERGHPDVLECYNAEWKKKELKISQE